MSREDFEGINGMAARYIDADRLLLVLQTNFGHTGGANTLKQLIGMQPTADVVEVKHGEWKKRGNEKKCSACKFIYYSNNDEWTFCPNCGAKMDGV